MVNDARAVALAERAIQFPFDRVEPLVRCAEPFVHRVESLVHRIDRCAVVMLSDLDDGRLCSAMASRTSSKRLSEDARLE